jgi:hypothetical protein
MHTSPLAPSAPIARRAKRSSGPSFGATTRTYAPPHSPRITGGGTVTGCTGRSSSVSTPVIVRVETERGGPAQLLRASDVHRLLPYYGRLARTAVRTVAGHPAPAIPLDDVTTQGSRRAVRPLWSEGLFDPGSALSGALYGRVAIAALLDESEPPGFTDWAVLGRRHAGDRVAQLRERSAVIPWRGSSSNLGHGASCRV